MSNALITFTTDFGTADSYVAAMKGVVLSIDSDISIIDISHEIPPQDVRECSRVLAGGAKWFPKSSVHLAVVDPGVGGLRKPLAGRFGDRYFVFPDNGLITDIAKQFDCQELVELRPEIFGDTSSTFHGRDIFAPAAAKLAIGAGLEDLGVPCEDFIKFNDELPFIRGNALVGQVSRIDHFGNIITNISKTDLENHFSDPEDLIITCDKVSAGPIIETYCGAGHGEVLALYNSTNSLEIAVNCGNAAKLYECTQGMEIVVKGKD